MSFIDNVFSDEIEQAATEIHAANVMKGFYDDRDRNRPNDLLAMLMLITTEVAELSEAVRAKDVPQSVKILGFTNEEEEAADVLIRLLDYAAFRDLRLGDAVVAKCVYNAARAHKHGKRA